MSDEDRGIHIMINKSHYGFISKYTQYIYI